MQLRQLSKPGRVAVRVCSTAVNLGSSQKACVVFPNRAYAPLRASPVMLVIGQRLGYEPRHSFVTRKVRPKNNLLEGRY
jgi:hypothetical protein